MDDFNDLTEDELRQLLEENETSGLQAQEEAKPLLKNTLVTNLQPSIAGTDAKTPAVAAKGSKKGFLATITTRKVMIIALSGLLLLIIILIITMASADDTEELLQPPVYTTPPPTLSPTSVPTSLATQSPTFTPTAETKQPTASPTTSSSDTLAFKTSTYQYKWTGDDIPSKDEVERHLKKEIPSLRDVTIYEMDDGEVTFSWTSFDEGELNASSVAKALGRSFPGLKDIKEMTVVNPFNTEEPAFWPCPLIGTNSCFEIKFSLLIFIGCPLLFCCCCCCFFFYRWTSPSGASKT